MQKTDTKNQQWEASSSYQATVNTSLYMTWLNFFFSVVVPHDTQLTQYAKHTGQFGLGIYRPAFLEALLPLLNPAHLHLNKKCTLITPLKPGSYKLTFEDGTTHETDLVIGADGIRSTVRNWVAKPGSGSNLAFANLAAYRGLVEYDTLMKAGLKTDINSMPVCFMGNDKVSPS